MADFATKRNNLIKKYLYVILFLCACVFILSACCQRHKEKLSGYYIPCHIEWDTTLMFEWESNEDLHNLLIRKDFTFFYFTDTEIMKFSSLNQMDLDSLLVGIENFTGIIANDKKYLDSYMIVTWNDKSEDTMYLNSEFICGGNTYCKTQLFCEESILRVASFYDTLKKYRCRPDTSTIPIIKS